MLLHRPPLVLGVLVAASLAAACSSKSVLNEHQLHTLLECPCPTLQPLAEYPLPAELPFANSTGASLTGITTGSDGNLWVAESDVNMIARVTPTGTVTEFPIPTGGAAPAKITAGPDGNLWATDYNLNIMHRITPSGAVTDFPLPPPLAAAPPGYEGIAAGPDGNIWFTHEGAKVVGVMSTSGVLLATYPIPTANSIPGFIVAGPDGNMWFAEDGLPTNCVMQIARVTTGFPSGTPGVITEFKTPTTECDPPSGSIGGMTVGQDHNIWFTERFNAQFGQITTGGAITEFAAPANPVTENLVRIVSTSDGSLWFTHNELHSPWTAQIGQMDLTGTVINLWSFPGALLTGMTVGPDGGPWALDEANALVVRL